MRQKRREFADGGKKRIYLIEFRDGAIKVGISGKLSGRMRQHGTNGAIKRAHIFGMTAQFYDEFSLKAKLCEIAELRAGTSEVFVNTSWDVVFSLCREWVAERIAFHEENNAILAAYDRQERWAEMMDKWMPFVEAHIAETGET